MSKITEAILIPLSTAVIAIGGGSFWLSSLYAKTTRLEEKVAALEEMQHDVSRIQIDIAEIKILLHRR